MHCRKSRNQPETQNSKLETPNFETRNTERETRNPKHAPLPQFSYSPEFFVAEVRIFKRCDIVLQLFYGACSHNH